jgi:anion-transporting  ArsA/GET3 family ATPase
MLLPGEPTLRQPDLFDSHRVIVCVGCGGVGKTTMSAALALAAAQRGLRTLCLTIDPARRLASALGLHDFPSQEQEVPATWLEQHGVRLAAPLTVMMLDAKRTFDELVLRHAAPEAARAILDNPIYAYLSGHLAGTRAYMAMERVLEAQTSGRFDLIVLDTPPSSRALDFFDAPEKMIEALDSPATRALVRAMEGGGFGLGLLALGVRQVLGAFDRIIGSHLLGDLAGLLASMNVLFGGFENRARQVSARLRSSEFGYVLVTSPAWPAIRDALDLGRAMATRALPIDLCVVNRLAPAVGELPSEEQLRASATWRELGLSASAAQPALVAAREYRERRQEEEARIARLFAVEAKVPRVLLTAGDGDIHRPDRLLSIGESILRAAASAA